MAINMRPLISVVIPTYNHAHYLDHCLQSLLDQTYTNWEAIVVDNHSKDNTDEVVCRFPDPRITFFKIHNNGVIAASRNMGICLANGEWIAFLDSDDWWTPDKLQVCIDHAGNDVDLIYHKLKINNKKPRLFQRNTIKSWQVRPPVIIDLMVNGNAIATSSVVVRKLLLEKIGGIDENSNMVTAEDYNTWLRIAQVTDKFKYIPKVLGFYMLHNFGMSRKDMSIPMKCASAFFVNLLNKNQKSKFDSNWRYAKGRHAFSNGDFLNANDDLLYCLRHGDLIIKIKSVYMLFGRHSRVANK